MMHSRVLLKLLLRLHRLLWHHRWRRDRLLLHAWWWFVGFSLIIIPVHFTESTEDFIAILLLRVGLACAKIAGRVELVGLGGIRLDRVRRIAAEPIIVISILVIEKCRWLSIQLIVRTDFPISAILIVRVISVEQTSIRQSIVECVKHH